MGDENDFFFEIESALVNFQSIRLRLINEKLYVWKKIRSRYCLFWKSNRKTEERNKYTVFTSFKNAFSLEIAISVEEELFSNSLEAFFFFTRQPGLKLYGSIWKENLENLVQQTFRFPPNRAIGARVCFMTRNLLPSMFSQRK